MVDRHSYQTVYDCPTDYHISLQGRQEIKHHNYYAFLTHENVKRYVLYMFEHNHITNPSRGHYADLLDLSMIPNLVDSHNEVSYYKKTCFDYSRGYENLFLIMFAHYFRICHIEIHPKIHNTTLYKHAYNILDTQFTNSQFCQLSSYQSFYSSHVEKHEIAEIPLQKYDIIDVSVGSYTNKTIPYDENTFIEYLTEDNIKKYVLFVLGYKYEGKIISSPCVF